MKDPVELSENGFIRPYRILEELLSIWLVSYQIWECDLLLVLVYFYGQKRPIG